MRNCTPPASSAPSAMPPKPIAALALNTAPRLAAGSACASHACSSGRERPGAAVRAAAEAADDCAAQHQGRRPGGDAARAAPPRPAAARRRAGSARRPRRSLSGPTARVSTAPATSAARERGADRGRGPAERTQIERERGDQRALPDAARRARGHQTQNGGRQTRVQARRLAVRRRSGFRIRPRSWYRTRARSRPAKARACARIPPR